jgi:hypothetical protein
VLSPYLQLAPDKTMEYIKTFHSIPPKELATNKWMGMPGRERHRCAAHVAGAGEFLKSADQLPLVPASFEPYFDSSFLAKMV